MSGGNCLLFQPMHEDYDLRQEQLNKASIMSSKKFLENLLEMFKTHVVSEFCVGCCLYHVAVCHDSLTWWWLDFKDKHRSGA